MKYKKNVGQLLVLITQFSINMIVPICLCMFIGVYLGEKFSMPIISVPFFIIGALAGFRNIYILAKKVYKDDKKEQKGDEENK